MKIYFFYMEIWEQEEKSGSPDLSSQMQNCRAPEDNKSIALTAYTCAESWEAKDLNMAVKQNCRGRYSLH